MSMEMTAIVPMRSGSKGIPDKNIRMLNNMPLFYWMVSALLESSVNKVVVSTDSSEYAKLVRTYCPKAIIEYRSKEVSDDKASSESVVLEYLDSHPETKGYILMAQLTSPLVTSDDVEGFLEYAKLSPDKSSLSVVDMSNRFIWEQNGIPRNYNPLQRPRRQDLKVQGTYLVENGMFYFNSVESWKSNKCRIVPPCNLVEMNPETLYEIDSPDDFTLVENLLRSMV